MTSSEIEIRIGETIIERTIAPARTLYPVISIPANADAYPLINGTTNRTPHNPKITDGIPANTSTAGFMIP
jgi:hypothetical protein